MSAQPTEKNNAGRGRAEHISLESELFDTRPKPNVGRVLKTYDLIKGGSGIDTSVSLLADHHLLVKTQRKRATGEQYTVDLRFVDPRPVGVRKVSRYSLYAALAFSVMTALVVGLRFVWPTLAQQIGGLATPIGLGALAVGAFVLCYYLTKESILFVSLHGRARVVVIAGRLGTTRRAHACAADIAAQAKAAQRHYKQPRQSNLRDEMREHSRLREEGVLTEAQYDEAKRRILQSHE
jgi:hypothetical protein